MSHQPNNLPHEWVKPPAGMASGKDRICARCGIKRSVGESTPCDREDRDIVIDTTHEYDPIA